MPIQSAYRSVALNGSKYPFSSIHLYISDDKEYPTPIHMTLDMDKLNASIRMTVDEVTDLRDALSQALLDRASILTEHAIAEAEKAADADPSLRESPETVQG